MALTTLLVLALLAVPSMAEQPKILVMPLMIGMNSRLFNLVKMGNMLADAGYNVTILSDPSTKPFIKTQHAQVYEVGTLIEHKFRILMKLFSCFHLLKYYKHHNI